MINLSRWIMAVPMIAFGMPTAPALAVQGGPLSLLYVITGVFDSGGALGAGVASNVTCVNFSGVPQDLQIIGLNFNGGITSNHTYTLTNGRTWTASTHGTNIFAPDSIESPGTVLDQGTFVILSTDPSMLCTAMVLDAAATVPNGISLHGVRVNPIPGTQE